MFLFWVKISFAFELKGCQLSEICITGFPYALYISSKAGITFVILVKLVVLQWEISTQDLGLQVHDCLMALAHKDLLLQLPSS